MEITLLCSINNNSSNIYRLDKPFVVLDSRFRVAKDTNNKKMKTATQIVADATGWHHDCEFIYRHKYKYYSVYLNNLKSDIYYN